MTRIHEILAAVGKAGLANWDELHAIVAAVETVNDVFFYNTELLAHFREKYGTVAAEAIVALNGEAN